MSSYGDYGDEYDPTPEEWELYSKQVEETEGFDVDDIVGVIMLGQIRPIDVEEDDIDAEEPTEFTKIAIQEFNRRKIQGIELEFEQLLNATYQLVNGFLYRLTFKAKDLAKEGESSTYQAMVVDRLEKAKVLAFRRKPSGSQMENWFWDSRGCCDSD